MRNFELAAAAILLPLLSLAQTGTDQPFTLRVNMEKADSNTRVYLAYQFDGKKLLDSALLKNGSFTFSGKTSRPLPATLVTDYEGLGSQALLKRTNQGLLDALKFYLHAGVTELRTDRLIKNAVFSGSVINADNERLKQLVNDVNQQYAAAVVQLRSIRINEQTARQDPHSSKDSVELRRRLLKQLDSLVMAEKIIIKKFIDENPNSYMSLVKLMEFAGAAPDLEMIEPMYNGLSAEIRNTVAGKEYYNTLQQYKNMVAGTRAPAFVQNDTAGNPVSLSSFKGKFVLLDFWASWCRPCRVDNPELVRIFNDFKDRNFTILGISLDEADGKEAWLKAIKNDNLSWPQVSDLKHWDNAVAKLYNVHQIPQSFLIGPDGVIIAKGLEPGELRKKLEELLYK